MFEAKYPERWIKFPCTSKNRKVFTISNKFRLGMKVWYILEKNPMNFLGNSKNLIISEKILQTSGEKTKIKFQFIQGLRANHLYRTFGTWNVCVWINPSHSNFQFNNTAFTIIRDLSSPLDIIRLRHPPISTDGYHKTDSFPRLNTFILPKIFVSQKRFRYTRQTTNGLQNERVNVLD